MKLAYSLSDIYPRTSSVLTTTEQTIPESDEEKQYFDSDTITNDNGKKEILNKTTVWGAILLFIGLLILLHFME